MKRLRLHIIFWVAFFINDVCTTYAWFATALKEYPQVTIWWLCAIATMVSLPIKMAICYYVMHIAAKYFTNNRKDFWGAIFRGIAALLVTTAVYRSTMHYYIYPDVFKLSSSNPITSIKSLFVTGMELLYIVALACTVKLLRLHALALEREKDLTSEKLVTELKMLRNQTNPHFLFNTLNNIYGLAKERSSKTPEVVLKLSKLLSYMLHESRKSRIPIRDEINMIEDYITLEQIRYSKRVSIALSQYVDDDKQLIAPLLMLPLVENAFKHGASESTVKAFVRISIKLLNKQLSFCVENFVQDQQQADCKSSIGLPNLKRQLELMYKDYNLDIEPHNNIFKVAMRINLESYGKF